ncbi:MAG: FHA domain-containing protein [Pseudomonadota bacterium]
MEDDKATRIIQHKPAAGAATGDDSATRVAGTKMAGDTDKSEATRMISGAPESGSFADLHVSAEPVVGWLVVVDGPGRGNSRSVYYGMNSMGRDESERIPLNFGDSKVSRQSHAFVVYDEKQQDYYVQHGGKSNLVRLNGAPVLTPMALARGDKIELGDTVLMFVPLCDESFNWEAAAT